MVEIDYETLYSWVEMFTWILVVAIGSWLFEFVRWQWNVLGRGRRTKAHALDLIRRELNKSGKRRRAIPTLRSLAKQIDEMNV